MDMRQLRERAGLRTIDVAYHLGVAESTVRNWESGRTVPKLTFAQTRLMMQLFNCSFEELEESVKESMTTEENSEEGSN
jgi:DNA-binding XRE family transcriptional regulator